MKTLAHIAAMLCLLLGAASSQADVIYDNGAPNQEAMLFSGYELTILDDFVLEAGSETITDIHWYGGYLGGIPAEDDFTLYIFDGDFNLLETIDGSATTRSSTGDDISILDYEEFYYELLIDPLALTAGETYYLGIANEDELAWSWEFSGYDGGQSAYWVQSIDFFVEGDDEFAYQLTGPGGVVPEPATLSLLGIGLVGMAVRKKFFAR